jgi:hypothetical protein
MEPETISNNGNDKSLLLPIMGKKTKPHAEKGLRHRQRMLYDAHAVHLTSALPYVASNYTEADCV